jgi:tetratricopeptide (TPR) repeat protein
MQPRICLIWTMMLAMAAGHCVGQTAAPPDQQRQAALALEQQGENVEAEAAWRTYLKAHPSSSEAYAHLGLLEARQGHYKEAVPLYRKALALDSRIPGLRLNLGLALFKAGEMKDALQEFIPLLKRAPQSSPDRQRLAILIGMCYYGLEDYAQAAPYLKEAAARDPQNLPLRLALAHSCLWSKQYQCVLDTYHEILMLNAESAEADMLAGEALDELKDSSGAIEQFRAAVKADPRMPDVHFGLGYLLWSKHRYEEAVPEFQAELANNPNHVQAMAHLGDAEMKLSHPEAAVPLFQNAIRVDPQFELAYLDLGILYADAGRNVDAMRQLKAAAKLAPNDVDVHWRLGRLYRAMGNKNDAKVELDKAKSITQAADTALINKMSPHPAQVQTPPAVPAGK